MTFSTGREPLGYGGWKVKGPWTCRGTRQQGGGGRDHGQPTITDLPRPTAEAELGEAALAAHGDPGGARTLDRGFSTRRHRPVRMNSVPMLPEQGT